MVFKVNQVCICFLPSASPQCCSGTEALTCTNLNLSHTNGLQSASGQAVTPAACCVAWDRQSSLTGVR